MRVKIFQDFIQRLLRGCNSPRAAMMRPRVREAVKSQLVFFGRTFADKAIDLRLGRGKIAGQQTEQRALLKQLGST